MFYYNRKHFLFLSHFVTYFETFTARKPVTDIHSILRFYVEVIFVFMLFVSAKLQPKVIYELSALYKSGFVIISVENGGKIAVFDIKGMLAI